MYGHLYPHLNMEYEFMIFCVIIFVGVCTKSNYQVYCYSGGGGWTGLVLLKNVKVDLKCKNVGHPWTKPSH